MDKMKKILLLALLLMPLRTLAENYGITVAGVEVTSENATNVTGENITAGTVSFDAQSETLTLNNVHANGQIIVTRSSMTINLVGVSIFNVNTDDGKRKYLIEYGGSDPSSTLTFKADELGAVIQGIGTTNDYKLDPVENYFDPQYDVADAWSLTYTNINNLCFCEISKPYLWVNSERLTDANKNEQLFEEVTVDLAKNTVTLNNLIIDNAASSWNFLVKSNLADLNVNITGGLNAFSLYAKENADVTSRAFIYTGASGEPSSLNLSIDQGSALRVSCSGKTASADWLVDGFTTSNIVTDAANPEVGQPIAKVGDPYDYQVTLVPYEPPTNYDLIVNGVQVNSDNAYDILGETAEGTLSYIASTNTLTLNGVYVSCESDFLDFSTEGLTVYLIGDNTIYCPSNDAVVFNSTVSDNTITFTTSTSNPGSLQIQSLNPFANVTPSYENGLIYDGSTDAKDIKPIKVPEIYADTSYEEDIPSYSLIISISDRENPTGTKYFYTIDYADASLTDVPATQAQDTDGDDAVDPIPLLGPCTVTVYAKYEETQSANVVGKLFGFASNTVTSQVGQAIEVPQVIPALDNDMTVNISPNDQDFVAEDKDGGYIATAAGSVVFSGNLQMGATDPEDYQVLNSDGMLGDFTVNILQDPQLIFYSEEALGEVKYAEAYIGRIFTAPELRYGSDMMPVTEVFTVTYQSSNEQVATVNSQTGEVTLVGLGDVTITATSEANDVYASGTASYELSVGRALDLRFDTNQWVTFYSNEDLTVPVGLTSYIVTGVQANTVTVSTTRYIPAGVGVLLYCESSTEYLSKAFTGSTAEFNYADDNLLRGVSTASVPSEQGPIYVLYNDEFVRLTAGTSVAANRCYLPLSLPASARLSIVFDDDVPTAISAISTSGADTAEGAWYTIDGRRLSGKPVKAGLYIQNGKKVSIK